MQFLYIKMLISRARHQAYIRPHELPQSYPSITYASRGAPIFSSRCYSTISLPTSIHVGTHPTLACLSQSHQPRPSSPPLMAQNLGGGS
ncbi:hypothetical protein AB1N83_007636 [Pleurotus pulmonarius]